MWSRRLSASRARTPGALRSIRGLCFDARAGGTRGVGRSPWLSDCYALRKRVAHEGVTPDSREAGQAFAVTTKLAGVVGSALRSDPVLAELGAQLPFGL
jgi:hypothetical protein